MPEVLILGASVRAAAQSAVNAGWQVTAADLFMDRDLQSIADCIQVSQYPQDLARIRMLRAELPVIYTGALENYPSLLDQFQRGGMLLGNDRATVQKLRDPFRLRDVFARRGVPFPATTKMRPGTNSHRWLRKSHLSAGGFQIQHCRPDLAADKDNYYQEFVNGTVCSASFVAAGRRAVLLGVTEMLVGCEWNGARDFVYAGSLHRDADSSECEQWIKIGTLIADEFGVVGLFGVDAIVRDERVIPIEINPRYTASMEVIERARKIPLMGMHVKACASDLLPAHDIRSASVENVGKLILYAKSATRIPENFKLVDQDTMLADVPQPNSQITAGQPMLTLIVQADCRSRLIDVLQSRAARVYDQLKSPKPLRSP